MKFLLSVEGAESKRAALEQAKHRVPAEIRLTLASALMPIVRMLRSYPPQAPSRQRPTTGAIRMYKRTGNYRNRITNPVLQSSGTEIVGYIASGADYSSYVRGDIEGKGQAWMHEGVWKPLAFIIQELLPGVVSTVDNALSQLFSRLGLK